MYLHTWTRNRFPTVGFLLSACTILVAGCFPEEEASVDPPIRGLVTTTVEAMDRTTIRRYPGVLEPREVNILSFEVGGRLGRLELVVGQLVGEGDLLAELDDQSFLVTIENRIASVEEAEANLAQAEDDLERSETLLASGTGTRVRRDEDLTEAKTRRAQLTQARKDLASAQEDLKDTKLFAPFGGIINAVEVDSFATVTAGQEVLSIYQAADFEVSFSVSFDVVADLVVGTPATIRLADDPSIVLDGVVSELGERADTVSSFPVVVRITEENPLIKAGMAVEVAFEFELPAERGFLIPITAAIPEGQIPDDAGPGDVVPVPVFVFDEASSTVQRRVVTMAGLRGNQFLIIDGVEPGERVATKGVSFLREGMQVKLLDAE
ncbi:MAG: efflux RND transporter periplasmic adaptor subunit [Pseudomonadota bacterium]